MRRTGKGVTLSRATSKTYIRICQQVLRDDWVQCGDCLRKQEEGVGNVRSVCPESPGLHALCNGRDNRLRLREEKLIP